MIQWVLPSVDVEWREACVATLHPSIRERLLIVDNTVTNLGVAASWNRGVGAAVAAGAEWLVLLSESMRFGVAGGTDFEARLDGQYCDSLWGWHLIGFRMTTLERVGRFDEAFFAYCEDTDYLYRLHLAGMASPRENDRPGRVQLTGIDAHDGGTEHSIRAGLVTVNLSQMAAIYRRKFGGDQSHETFTHPYNRPDLDWRWTGPPP